MLTPEQKELRRTGIGGSDVAPIVGLSRYKSNVDLYLEKLGYRDFDQESEAAYWGSVLEEIVANEFSKRNSEIIPGEFIKNPKYPWMFANIDRRLKEKNVVLECKTASIYKANEWGEQGTDEIPDEYLLQVAHYRIVTACDFVAIAVLIGGQEYRQYKYEKNSKLEDKIINNEHEFWYKHVLSQEPPQIKTYEDACKLFGKAINSSKKANETIETYLKSYSEALSKIKEFKEHSDALKAKIAAHLGEDSMLINDLGQTLATWKNKKCSRFDTTLFKEKHPELYNQFVKTSETREFRLKEVSDE